MEPFSVDSEACCCYKIDEEWMEKKAFDSTIIFYELQFSWVPTLQLDS